MKREQSHDSVPGPCRVSILISISRMVRRRLVSRVGGAVSRWLCKPEETIILLTTTNCFLSSRSVKVLLSCVRWIWLAFAFCALFCHFSQNCTSYKCFINVSPSYYMLNKIEDKMFPFFAPLSIQGIVINSPISVNFFVVKASRNA